MSFSRNGFGNFIQDMTDMKNDLKGFFDVEGEQPNTGDKKPNFPIPLSKSERKAFVGLCSLQGKSVPEKVAELIQDYIEEKRQKMGK